MAQIQGGTTYITGGQVTAANLNAHVNNAVLVPGAISDQASAASCTTSDNVLILQAGSLKKATLSQVQASITPDLTGYLPRSGSSPMTGELTLSSATPGGALSAVPKTYVDSNLATKQGALGYTPVNKAGDTAVGPLALAADPVSALQVTTKQYVDNLAATKVNVSGGAFTGAVTLQADPTVALGAATKQYVDTQASASTPAGAIMAFYRSTPPAGWIECNGQSAASYPNLVALGITNVPDLRGQFVRGWDNGRGVDPGRSFGSAQTDDFKSHFHTTPLPDQWASSGAGPITFFSGGSRGYSGFSGVSDSKGGTETRPKNIALMYCIKT